ncbi:MFS family sugar transporter [Candidatus Vecturithrix granuli]|uniref:MFS family sugar transporter n=1 Tax=Vecturithrix granuli TaxID=1499967 RepID=A0A081C2L3_VECG1|nr:MFS family sugar transporter [Candidatus Vecturithrix granuli]
MNISTILPMMQTTKASKTLSITIGYYVAFLMFGLVAAVLGPTLPGLASQTHTTIRQVSMLFTARSLGYLFGAFLGGRLYDRFPGHPILSIVLAMMTIIIATVPLIPFLWGLLTLLLLLGVIEGVLELGGNTLLVWLHKEKTGPFMNGLHFFFGVGAFVTPLIVGQVFLHTGQIQWAYWILAILILPSAGWLCRLPSPEIQSNARHQEQNAKKTFLVGVIVVLFLLYVGSEVSFGGWIYTYTISLYQGVETTAAYLTSAFWGALTFGRLLAIPFAAYFAPRLLLLANFIGCLISVSLLLIGTPSLTIIWIGTLGVGVSMAPVFPTLLTFAGRHIQITAKINSWFCIGSGVGGMTLPLLIGQVFEIYGPQAVMFTIFADLILGLGLLLGVMLCSFRFRQA